jgi:hypothetical protein
MTTDTAVCPACGKPTPDENLRCIFCGELLPASGGVLGRIRYGRWLRWAFVAVAIALLWVILRYWV